MKIVQEISANEMIGEFLKAELHSSRFRAGSLKALKMLGYDESLVENPDYSIREENQKRAKVLGLCRGWPDTELFDNFPRNTHWYRCTLSLNELKKAYRLKSSDEMTDDERSVGKASRRILEGLEVKNINPTIIHQIRSKIMEGANIPPMVMVSNSLQSEKYVLIEGHSRSVAYGTLDNLDHEIPAVVGVSSKMNDWRYF